MLFYSVVDRPKWHNTITDVFVQCNMVRVGKTAKNHNLNAIMLTGYGVLVNLYPTKDLEPGTDFMGL